MNDSCLCVDVCVCVFVCECAWVCERACVCVTVEMSVMLPQTKFMGRENMDMFSFEGEDYLPCFGPNLFSPPPEYVISCEGEEHLASALISAHLMTSVPLGSCVAMTLPVTVLDNGAKCEIPRESFIGV